MSDEEKRQRAADIGDAALDLEVGPARDAFVERTCVDDLELARLVKQYISQAAGVYEGSVIPRKESIDIDRHGTQVGSAAAPAALGPLHYLGRKLKSRYRLIKVLGSGGFATAYLAHDGSLVSKPVVVKVLHRAQIDPWLLRKFKQEKEALARIDHPGVISVLDEGEVDGLPFLVVEFVDGVPLGSLVRQGGMDFHRAGEILRQVGRALQAAHDKGVLHRDLKPSNIMVQSISGEDHIRLIDFGIAGIEASVYNTSHDSTRAVGTWLYMAPEQMKGECSRQSDIFAFAAVAFELITGQPLAESPIHLLSPSGARGERLRKLRPEIRRSSATILVKALSVDPKKRYASARVFGDRLADSLQQQRVNTALQISGLAATLVTVVLAGSYGLSYWSHKGPPMAKAPAQRESAAIADKQRPSLSPGLGGQDQQKQQHVENGNTLAARKTVAHQQDLDAPTFGAAPGAQNVRGDLRVVEIGPTSFGKDVIKLVGRGSIMSASQGWSVALSGDGSTAVIGGPSDGGFLNLGTAWIFDRANGAWNQEAKLIPAGAEVQRFGSVNFGLSVAISANGNTVALGGPNDNGGQGAVWIFVRTTQGWTQQGGKIVKSGLEGKPAVGSSVSLSADGNTLLVGSSNLKSSVGAAWVFRRSNGIWIQVGDKLIGDGEHEGPAGVSVALSGDGRTAVVGDLDDNNWTGAAWVFTESGIWTQQGNKLAVIPGAVYSFLGCSVSLSRDGNTMIVGASGYESAGAAWVFTRRHGVWTQEGKLAASDALGEAQFGRSVSLSGDGNIAAIGGPSDNGNSGAVWIFKRIAGTWYQQGKLVGPGAAVSNVPTGHGQGQGWSVSVSADATTVIMGAPNDGDSLGAVWVFSAMHSISAQ